MDLLDNHLYYINDAELSEYFFNCMKNAGPDRKRNLNHRELKFFKDEKTMRKFADNENLDRRLLMMMRLGYNFSFVIYPEGENVGEALKQTVGQYQFADKRRKVIEMFMEKKIFVTTSREYMLPMYFAAQNSHSNLYVLDKGYQKLHEKFGQLNGGKSIAALMRDFSDTVKFTGDFALSILNAINSIKSITGVNFDELRVLIYLFGNRHTMVSMQTIMFALGDGAKSTKIQRTCASLCNEGFIEREPGTTKNGIYKRNYMIMEQGIRVVLSYIDYVLYEGIRQLTVKSK